MNHTNTLGILKLEHVIVSKADLFINGTSEYCVHITLHPSKQFYFWGKDIEMGLGYCKYDKLIYNYNITDNLVTDYQFTFNLSKKEDKPYTQINFMNIPSSVR